MTRPLIRGFLSESMLLTGLFSTIEDCLTEMLTRLLITVALVGAPPSVAWKP
jgi:hypothetical protein